MKTMRINLFEQRYLLLYFILHLFFFLFFISFYVTCFRVCYFCCRSNGRRIKIPFTFSLILFELWRKMGICRYSIQTDEQFVHFMRQFFCVSFLINTKNDHWPAHFSHICYLNALFVSLWQIGNCITFTPIYHFHQYEYWFEYSLQIRQMTYSTLPPEQFA